MSAQHEARSVAAGKTGEHVGAVFHYGLALGVDSALFEPIHEKSSDLGFATRRITVALDADEFLRQREHGVLLFYE